MLPRDSELMSELTGVQGGGGGKSVKRFEWSNGLDNALYKNTPLLFYVHSAQQAQTQSKLTANE